MVQTRAATKRIESGQPLPDITVASSPPKKRRVDGARPPKKRHRGKPGELCKLNLDVLFLLAAYVHPLDLLNLARTCKSLRELLMGKASAFVWKTARRQVKGLPDCPADMTEPEYANLVFYARCHSCGKYAKKVHWSMRRRYCLDCRRQQLRCLSSCPDIIRNNYVLPMEYLVIDGEKATWVDKEQVDLFINEYDHSSDKEKLLREKHGQERAMSMHASKCMAWEQRRASERRYDLESRRRERSDSIFECLKQHGYEPEIAHFGHYAIQQSHKSFFRASKPLTDKEWEKMLPDWHRIMQDLRSQRLEKTVYRARRDLLTSEYASYVASRSPNSPVFEVLPRAADVARFPPFQEVILAPEGTEMGEKPFESAFEQLPGLVEEWKKKMDAEFAELVEIPSHLSSQVGFGDPGVASSSATPLGSPEAPTNKLRLACAVFIRGHTASCYPEVLSSVSASPYPEPEGTQPAWSRFNIRFVKGAPYIVHACGLDPNTATVEDADRRNARLKCLLCNSSCIMTWRCALRHAIYHEYSSTSPSKSPPWELMSDEHMDAIQAAELSSMDESFTRWTRCLVCHPCVGDEMFREDAIQHVIYRHGVEEEAVQEGVHYKPVGLYEPRMTLQMIEEGGQVTFRKS